MDKFNEVIEGWETAVKLLNHGCGITRDRNIITCLFWSQFNKKDNLISIHIEKYWVIGTYNDMGRNDCRTANSNEIGIQKTIEEITKWISLL